MLLGKLFDGAGIEYPEEFSDIEISRIVTDSREVSDGCMFIALEGYNSNGHEYINEAVKKGAVVIVAEQVRDECVGGAAIIKVESTRRAAALLYNVQCKYPSSRLKLVGVTGTNGKTSVCFMLESIFRAAGRRCAVIGTLGCRIDGKESGADTGGLTTPAPERLYPLLERLADDGIIHVFMEISSQAISLHRTDGLELDCAVFTNLTRDHLDFHKSMNEYFEVKASLLEHSRRQVINADDAYGKKLSYRYENALTCSKTGARLTATDINYTSDGADFRLAYDGGEFMLRLGVLGEFSVMNALEAAAVALDAGISPSCIAAGLANFNGALGRMERVDVAAPFDVIIDYAHTPDALEQLLMSARAQRRGNGRIILVFGCGGDRDRGKRKEMAHIASRLADIVIVTSDNPRNELPEAIISDVMRGMDKEGPHERIASRKRAIEYAIELAGEGDMLLLAGKGHEKYEIDADGKHFFDERSIVKEAVGKRIKNNG